MEIIPCTYYENLKRYWRRRKYQRLNGANNNKRKLKIMRLGGNVNRRLWKIRPKLKLNICSPVRLLMKFHDAYINMMIRLAGNTLISSVGVFGGKRVAKGRQVTMVSSGGEVVDDKLVLEIYKRIVSTREFTVF